MAAVISIVRVAVRMAVRPVPEGAITAVMVAMRGARVAMLRGRLRVIVRRR